MIAGFAAALAVALALAGGRSLVCVVLAAVAIGASLGFAHAATVHARAEEGLLADGVLEIEVLEDGSNAGFGESALARLSDSRGAKAVVEVRFGSDDPVLAGQRFAVSGTFKPADYGKDAYAWRDGASGTFTATSCEELEPPFPLGQLIRIRREALAAIGDDSDTQRLLQALVCGYRHDMRGSELYAWFQTCGLAHFVAVSGAHLVIVTGILASALKLMRVPRKVTVCVLAVSMASYFVVAGMPVSALRAAIMSLTGLLSFFARRRASSLNAVGVGIVIILCADPTASISASFALSALSTTGIVMFSPIVSAWLAKTPVAKVPAVSDALSLTLSAGLLSQLYACSLFNQLPLMSPLANVICAPLFPLVCGTGLIMALVGVVVPAAAPIAMAVATVPAILLRESVHLLSQIPYACVPFSIETGAALVVSGLAAVMLWACWPRDARTVFKAVAACAIAFAVVFLATADTADKIVMLDVGQGDSFLVQSQGKSMLVDTGNQDAQLLGQLALCRITHLDAVVITHADDDHCGSLDALQRAVECDRVIVARDMVECEGDSAQSLMRQARLTAREVRGISQNDQFTLGGFTMRVAWPSAFSDEGGNADSLCLVVTYDGDDDGEADATVLMTGDAEKDQIAEMLDSGLVGDIDVLKVGHHGSKNAMTLDDARELSPAIALVSCGKDNRYGHPAENTLQILEQIGATVYRTDLHGQVKCDFTSEGMRVTSGNR